MLAYLGAHEASDAIELGLLAWAPCSSSAGCTRFSLQEVADEVRSRKLLKAISTARPGSLLDILTSDLKGFILSLSENEHISRSKASSCGRESRLWHTHCHPKLLN